MNQKMSSELEDVVEVGELEHAEHRRAQVAEKQLPLVPVDLLEGLDQGREPRRVDERHAAHVDDDPGRLAVEAGLELAAQLRGGVDVHTPRHRQHDGFADFFPVHLQRHWLSPAVLADPYRKSPSSDDSGIRFRMISVVPPASFFSRINWSWLNVNQPLSTIAVTP